MIHPGIWIYVWQDPPAAGALNSYDGALVRAANGNGVKNPSGFSFADNYDRWVKAFGPDRISPWTYLYPSSSGETAANALFGSAGKQPAYQVDLEEAVPAATIRAFCDRMRALAPGCKLIFDSYPTRAQFVRVNGSAGAATWDQAVRSFDVFCPQVYYSSQQDDGWEKEFAGKPITPAFSPENWAAWSYFQTNLDRFGSAKLWRYTFTNAYKGKLHYAGGDMSAAEVAEIKDAIADARDATVRRVLYGLFTDDLLTRPWVQGDSGYAGWVNANKTASLPALLAKLLSVAAGVGALSDDEAKFLAALAGSESRLLAALAGLSVGDPNAVQTIVEEIRKQPAETVAAIKEAL